MNTFTASDKRDRAGIDDAALRAYCELGVALLDAYATRRTWRAMQSEATMRQAVERMRDAVDLYGLKPECADDATRIRERLEFNAGRLFHAYAMDVEH